MREQSELKRVLSPRFSKLRREQSCSACGAILEKGEMACSYGVIDRMTREWTREYFCGEHELLLDNLNTADLPEFEQDYLIENGFANEKYMRG